MTTRTLRIFFMFRSRLFIAATVAQLGLGAAAAQTTVDNGAASGQIERKHRSHLPLPNTARQSLVTYDAKSPDTKFPPIEQLHPPKGAPNVLVVLIDDAGFGASSTFGGP